MLKPYPDMKDSGVNWLGIIPNHWQVQPGRACYTTKQIPNKGMIESTVLSLSYGKIVIKPTEKLHGLVPESFETYQLVNPEDIICRPTDLQNDQNSLRFGRSDHRGIITSAYLCINTLERLMPLYGHMLLHTYDLKKVFYGYGSGLRQNLSWSDFTYLPCIVPPLPEQAAIVKYLDYMDRRIKKLIVAKKKLIKLMEEQNQAIIHQAVTKGLDPNVPMKDSGVAWLGEVPAHWEVRRLRSLTHIKTGGRDTVDRVDEGEFPFFVRSQTVEHIDTWSFDGEAVLTAGDGAGVAKVFHYVNGRFDYHQRVYKFSDFRDVLGKYFFEYFSITLKYEALAGNAKSTVDSLRLPMLQNFPVVLPPKPNQAAIVEHIDQVKFKNDTIITRTKSEIKLLNEYHSRLVSDVVTGKLDVREVARNIQSDTPENIT